MTSYKQKTAIQTKCGKMQRCCMEWWPNYELDDGLQWLENGLLQFKIVLQYVFVVNLENVVTFVF